MSGPEGVVDIVEEDLPLLDVRAEEFLQDPHGVLSKLREGGPVARSHRGIELLTADLCAAVVANDEFETLGVSHFRDREAPESLVSFVENGLLLNMERARHDRIRRVMARAFTIRKMEDQRELMRAVAQRLLARVLEAGGGDLVGDFTEPYPMEVLCRLIGVPPHDMPTFQHAAIDLHLMGAVPLAPGFSRLDEALQILWDFVAALVEARAGDPRPDLVSALVAAQSEQAELTRPEVVWNLVNLLFAGQDTTRFQLASAVRVLAEAPGVWDGLAEDPGGVGAALEEAMRLQPVSLFLVRCPPSAAIAAGFRFPAGRRVVVNLLAASRDPQAFSAPDSFGVDRPTRYRLPFGWGIHYCLGQALARTEMCEALRVMTQTMACPVFHEGAVEAPVAGMLGGPVTLPGSFVARS